MYTLAFDINFDLPYDNHLSSMFNTYPQNIEVDPYEGIYTPFDSYHTFYSKMSTYSWRNVFEPRAGIQ